MNAHKLISILCTLVVAHLTGCTNPDAHRVGGKNHSIQHASQALALSRKPPIEGIAGIYFGTTTGSLAGQEWGVSIIDDSTGYLYAEPSRLKLATLKTGPAPVVEFATRPGLGDVVVAFKGKQTSLGLEGALTVGAPTPKVIPPHFIGTLTSNILMKRIIPDSSAETSLLPEGVYSGIEFNEESGDLVGEALLIVRTASGYTGILTSAWDGLVSYAATNIVVDRHSIRFAIVTPEDTEHFKGTFETTSAITLRHTDADTVPGVSTSVLRRHTSLQSIFGVNAHRH
jgi:hypothetical protein